MSDKYDETYLKFYFYKICKQNYRSGTLVLEVMTPPELHEYWMKYGTEGGLISGRGRSYVEKE